MPKLYFIPAAPNRAKISLAEALPPVRLLRESSVEPTHEEILEELMPVSRIWEHVSVLADGERLHLFCDDNGLAYSLPPNLRASLLYANATLKMSGRTPYSLEHILESAPDTAKFVRYSDYTLMIERSLFILGDCLLWTGDLS
jgi:hypothetical protein